MVFRNPAFDTCGSGAVGSPQLLMMSGIGDAKAMPSASRGSARIALACQGASAFGTPDSARSASCGPEPARPLGILCAVPDTRLKLIGIDSASGAPTHV